MAFRETVLREDVDRFVIFPIRYPTAYKDAQKCFWTVEEIDFSSDLTHWTQALTQSERNLLSVILAFFAASDGIVAENLAQQFYAEVQIPEVRCFYGFQIMMENVHAETYSRLLQELILDEDELRHLFGAMKSIPTVKAKAGWCLKWFDRKAYSFAVRVLAFAIVEGIFFSSSFAAILWIRSRGLLPGLSHSNELIMRDEGQHMEFACKLYRELDEVVSLATVYTMVAEAVALERSFFAYALPTPLRGMNAMLMDQYVGYVADFLLWRLGYRPLYAATNPFPFMESAAIPGRANFFDRGVSDYVGAAVAGDEFV